MCSRYDLVFIKLENSPKIRVKKTLTIEKPVIALNTAKIQLQQFPHEDNTQTRRKKSEIVKSTKVRNDFDDDSTYCCLHIRRFVDCRCVTCDKPSSSLQNDNSKMLSGRSDVGRPLYMRQGAGQFVRERDVRLRS